MHSPYTPMMGGFRGGGFGKVNLTTYSRGFSSSCIGFSSSAATVCCFERFFCCFLVNASFWAFSLKQKYQYTVYALDLPCVKQEHAIPHQLWPLMPRVKHMIHNTSFIRVPSPKTTHCWGKFFFISMLLTACLEDFPDCFISRIIFSCFSYCFIWSRLFCPNIFLNVAGKKHRITSHQFELKHCGVDRSNVFQPTFAAF